MTGRRVVDLVAVRGWLARLRDLARAHPELLSASARTRLADAMTPTPEITFTHERSGTRDMTTTTNTDDFRPRIQVARHLSPSDNHVRDRIDAACADALTTGKQRGELASHAFVLCDASRSGGEIIAEALGLPPGRIRFGWASRADFLRAIDTKAQGYAMDAAAEWSNPRELRRFRGPPAFGPRGAVVVVGYRLSVFEEQW